MHCAYVELTNVGATTLDLSQFEFGVVGPWTKPYLPGTGGYMMLPNKLLAPGKSFVIAKVNDYVTRMWAKSPDLFNRYESKPEMYKLADMQIHIKEASVTGPQSVDSVSPYASIMTVWNGSYCWYLRYHYMLPGDIRDSVVVDQVGGIFDDTDGTSKDVQHDVAGFTNATGNAVLIRKSNVTKGNLDFANGRGSNETDGEWIAVPYLLGGWEPLRAVFWTTGNHGDYHLNSLTSSVMNINWTDKILTVPWGVRNDDSIMYKFNRVPGIAWHYDYAPNHADSAYVSVRTGDKLTVYACGNQVEKVVFDIVALPPTASDNKVIPKYVPNNKGWYPGAAAFCEVSDNAPGMDTISMFAYGTRVDTLLKYLEKPAKAKWDLIWVDGVQRADVKKGDILKITSENGAVKQYYVKPNRYYPSHNAYLSSITWPDIPEFYKGILGWEGDTIPNFMSSKLEYKVMVPWDVNGIPGLVGKKAQLNATLQVTKAANLIGGVSDRTVTFTNVAEDDTSTNVYKIELYKERDQSNIQPWAGEPFISQFVWRQDYNNDALEIVNPGTDALDLSNYMLVFGFSGSISGAITKNSGTGDWANRYNKYIPGYKWVDEATWTGTPARVIPDISVNTTVRSGDVFCLGHLKGNPSASTYPTFIVKQLDIDFVHNPWGENLTADGAAMDHWWNQKVILFKILNDSIQRGLKPANDPNDFQVIDVMGDIPNSRWNVGGIPIDQVTQYVRKPWVYKGNPVIEGSFGTTEDNSEWIMMNETRYQAAKYGWPDWRLMVADGIGSHFMYEATIYKSTVSSGVYKVSLGYSLDESIKGIASSTTLNTFYTNIVKADTGQHLKVRKVADGSLLAGTDIVSTGDTLIVVSADSVNTSKYILNVSPLSSDALLTSATYTISVNGSAGTISNFPYGTPLKTIVDGVTVPADALMNVVDAKGAYQPMKMLAYDTTYVDVLVNDQIKFEVIAENGTTKIIYQLKPTASNTDAFITSVIYTVNQTDAVVSVIPGGTSVEGFLPNLVPVTGASFKLIDKYGLERIVGIVSKDDKIVVTAADGVTTKTYYLEMLNEPRVYPVYVLSAIYNVNQVALYITGPFTVTTTVSNFIANLQLAPFATVTCLTSLGVEKAGTENIAEGDIIRATSGDLSKSLDYIVSIGTSNPTVSQDQFSVYPNPSLGNITVLGIEAGNRISVYNTLGGLVLDKIALQAKEEISLENQPKGIYFVKVVTNDKKVTTVKIVIE
jgi:hypothetical protein